MKKILLGITTILMAITLFSCNPDNLDFPNGSDDSVKKVSIMGDSYSTFEGWSNIDMAGNHNDYYVYYPHKGNTDVTSVDKTMRMAETIS